MLRSSSYSSEEDQDHNRSSPSDHHHLPPPRFSLRHCPPPLSTVPWPTSSLLPPLVPPFSSAMVSQPRQLLITCAELISKGDFSSANRFLGVVSSDFASQFGDSSERLLFYFSRALSFRLDRHFPSCFGCVNPSTSTGIVPSLHPVFVNNPNPNPNSSSQRFLSSIPSMVRHSSYLSLNQVTPFIRFIHLTANQAILEAVEGLKVVHIFDMDIMHGVQWPPLLQAVVEQSTTLGHQPPKVRITGVGRDLTLLHRTGDRLSKFAQSLGCLEFHFEFHPLVVLNLEGIDPAESVVNALEMHRHNSEHDEIVAVHCGDYLHRLLREYDMRGLRRFLHKVKTVLNPRVLTLGEREADHNHPLFLRRFMEALDHYGAIFDSLEATLPPQSQERVAVEEGWFGEEIKDVVGEEGEQRKERHQKYESWEVMLRNSGFKGVALSPFSLSQAKLLLRLHYPSEGYQLQVIHNNCLLLGWKNRPLFSISSWQ